MSEFEKFRGLIRTLRGENGCPWDRRQTMETLAPFLREEVEEAIVEIERGSDTGMREELGDVMLILLMLIQVGEEDGRFTFDEVMKEVGEKIVRRHPHVFGDVKVKDEKEIIEMWEKIKQQEKRGKSSE